MDHLYMILPDCMTATCSCGFLSCLNFEHFFLGDELLNQFVCLFEPFLFDRFFTY